MLKAKLSQSIKIGEVKAIKEYLKETIFEESKVKEVISETLRNNSIGFTDILKIELTAYGVGETVVNIIAEGIRRDIEGVNIAFVQMYFTYEKGIDDIKMIVRIYKEEI